METDYIKMLAANTGTDISTWDLKKLFGNVKDKRELNKRFFDHAKSNESKPIKVEIPKAISKTV